MGVTKKLGGHQIQQLKIIQLIRKAGLCAIHLMMLMKVVSIKKLEMILEQIKANGILFIINAEIMRGMLYKGAGHGIKT